MNNNQDSKNSNGKNLIDTINYRLNCDENDRILEYDIQLASNGNILDTAFFRIEQNHYLLINKALCKDFYFHWREKYFSIATETDVSNDSIDLITKCVLLINPNFASAWSKRKNLVVNSVDLRPKELEFNRLILTKHFKCEQAYLHRRWLVKKIISSYTNLEIEVFMSKEINFIIDYLSKRVKSNYYCWSYLNWLLGYLIDLKKGIDLKTLYLGYLGKYEEILYRNPSDFCVYHFRLNLIRLVYKNLGNEIDCSIMNEIKLVNDLILRFSEYLTVWNYCKYFLLFLKQFSDHVNRFGGFENKFGEIKTSFIEILENSNSKIDFNKIFDSGLINFDLILKYEFQISKIVSKTHELSKHEHYSSIKAHSDSFNKFLEKFLFIQ